jgi:hypothetical protein
MEYGPDKLLLFPDEKIRHDLQDYKWKWDRFIGGAIEN